MREKSKTTTEAQLRLARKIAQKKKRRGRQDERSNRVSPTARRAMRAVAGGRGFNKRVSGGGTGRFGNSA